MSPAKQFIQQRTPIPSDVSDKILFPNQVGSFALQLLEPISTNITWGRAQYKNEQGQQVQLFFATISKDYQNRVNTNGFGCGDVLGYGESYVGVKTRYRYGTCPGIASEFEWINNNWYIAASISSNNQDVQSLVQFVNRYPF